MLDNSNDARGSGRPAEVFAVKNRLVRLQGDLRSRNRSYFFIFCVKVRYIVLVFCRAKAGRSPLFLPEKTCRRQLRRQKIPPENGEAFRRRMSHMDIVMGCIRAAVAACRRFF